MSKRARWTVQQEEKLVELWREKECLYNVSSPLYHDRIKKEAAWREIAVELQMPALEVQTRASSLRTQFSKLLHPKPSGSGTKELTSRQNWILRNLDFLRTHVQPRQGVSTLNLDEMYDSGEDQMLENEDVDESDTGTSESSSHAPSQPRNTTVCHKHHQKAKLREEDKLEREKLDILRQVASSAFNNNEDSDDIFGKQVANEMRVIKDPAEKMQVRRAIMRVLYEAQDRFMSAQYREQVQYPKGPTTQPVYSPFVDRATPRQPYFQVPSYQQSPASSYTQMLSGSCTQLDDLSNE